MGRLLRLFSKSPRGLTWLLLLFKLKPLAPGLDLRYETGTLKTCSYRSGRVTADGLPFAAAFLCIGQAAKGSFSDALRLGRIEALGGSEASGAS